MDDTFTRARARLADDVAAAQSAEERRALLVAAEAELVAALAEVHQQLAALRGEDPEHHLAVAAQDVEEPPDGRPAAGQVSRVPRPQDD